MQQNADVTLTAAQLAHRIADIILDKKGLDLVVLAIGETSDIADYMIIASGTNRRQVADDIHRNSGSGWDAAVPIHIHASAMEIEPGMKRLLRQRCNSRLDVLDKVSRIRVANPLNNDDPPVVCLHARTTLRLLTPTVKADIRALMGAGIQVFVRQVDEAWLLQPLLALAVDGIAGRVLGSPRCATAFRQLVRYEQNRCTPKHSLPPRRAPRVASNHYSGRDEAYSGVSRTSRTFAARSFSAKGLLSR